jgi:hypothetical protein
LSVNNNFLAEMRKSILLTKRMSEFHLNNLKNFAFIAFDNLNKIEISYNIDCDPKMNNYGYIHFNLSPKPRKAISSKNTLSKRCSDVDSWTKNLLWKEISVEIFNKNKKIYPSE